MAGERLKPSIKLSEGQRSKLLNDLQNNGIASIENVVVLKLDTVKMKGRELIDPENPSKGFRITDRNKTYVRIDATVTKQFKRDVKVDK